LDPTAVFKKLDATPAKKSVQSLQQRAEDIGQRSLLGSEDWILRGTMVRIFSSRQQDWFQQAWEVLKDVSKTWKVFWIVCVLHVVTNFVLDPDEIFKKLDASLPKTNQSSDQRARAKMMGNMILVVNFAS